MTKRFVLAYEKGNEAIFEDRDYPYPKRMTNKQVERKLNELAEENEQLKLVISKLDEDNTYYIVENRRLKEKYDYDIEDYRQSNAELKEENKVLKKKLESLQKILHIVECVSNE